MTPPKSRPAVRGQGYMKKGGVAATQAHNDRVRALHAEETGQVLPSRPTPVAASPDGPVGRASARPGRPAVVRDRVVLVGGLAAVSLASGAAGAVVALLAEGR